MARRGGASLLVAGLALTFAGVGTASADEAVRTLEEKPADTPGQGNVNGQENGNAGGQGNQGGGQDNPNAGGGNAGGQGGQADNPGGNNGSVKIRGNGDRAVNNTPKVSGCGFYVDWYGYAEGGTGTVLVTLASPTGGEKGDVVFNDTAEISDSGAGGAANDYDDSMYVVPDLDGVEATNPNGYHLRVEITTTSNVNNEDAQQKFKMIWYSPGDGCSQGTIVDCTTDPTLPICPTRGSDGSNVIVLDDVVTAPVETPAPVLDTQVQVQENAPVAAPAADETQVEGVQLARTGALTDRLLQAAGLCLVLGGLAFAGGRKERVAVAPTRRR